MCTLQETYPHAEHVFRNGAVPGTHSGYMSLCVKWHVPENADLVLVCKGLIRTFIVEPCLPASRAS